MWFRPINNDLKLILDYLNEKRRFYFSGYRDSIGSQIQIQTSVADLNMILVASKRLQDLASELLAKLIETTGSNLGSFHLLTEDGTRFEHFASLGVSPELLKPFDPAAFARELGRTVATKEISPIRLLRCLEERSL